MKRAAVLAFMCLAPLAMASPAKASVIYTLTADHFGGAGSGTLGTVTVTTVSTGVVDMTISLNNGNRFVLTGQDGSTVGFNTSLTPDPTLTLVSSSLTGWSLDNGGVPSALDGDGFGNFEYSLNCCSNTQGGGAAQTGPVTLRLSGTGLTENSFGELSNNPPGDTRAFFAVDVIGAAGGTGFIGGTTPGSSNFTPVPEPGTLVLLGLGLTAAGRQIRKRRAA
jgi:hypothetical protein